MDVTNVNSKEIEMHELVIVGSRYSKHLKDRLLPIYEKGEPMSAEELGRLLGGMTLVVRPVEDNTFDFHAVGARTEENLFLGFVWMYQSYALREWMMDQGVKCIKARIKRVNTKYGLIFAEVEGMKLKCQVRDNYNIDTDWASGLPRVLPYNNSMSLDVAMFLLHEALTENMDYEHVSSRFENLLTYLPTDLSAHYYRECVVLYHLMEQSPLEKVREMRDTLLHTFVNRGSTEKMEWWVKECLPRFISLAEDENLLGLYEAAKFTLRNINDGLCSRVAIFLMERANYQMVRKNVVDRKTNEELKQWGFKMEQLHGELPLERLVDHVYSLCELSAQEAEAAGDLVLDYLRKRAVFYATWFTVPRILARQYDTFRKTGKLEITDDDLKFATLMYDAVIWFQDYFFGQMLQDSWDNAEREYVPRRKNSKNADAYRDLPETFTTKDVMSILDIEQQAAMKQCQRWTTHGFVTIIKKGKYKKIFKEIMI